MDKDYLGDGVYVEHDGYQLMLSADSDGQANRIYLDPTVFAALVRYRDRLLDRASAAQQAGEAVANG